MFRHTRAVFVVALSSLAVVLVGTAGVASAQSGEPDYAALSAAGSGAVQDAAAAGATFITDNFLWILMVPTVIGVVALARKVLRKVFS